MQYQYSAFKALLTEIEAIDRNLDQETFTHKALLLLGQTKAGKTTLFYYLNGKQLVRQKNSIQVWELVPEANFGNAIVGSNYSSTTVYPNISSMEDKGAIVIDMPGFDDDRHYLLLNIHVLISTLKKLREAHLCLVLPQDDSDSDSLIRELKKITSIFRQEVLVAQHNLSFILTKVEHPGAEEDFRMQLQEIMASELLQEVNPLLTASSKLNVYQFSTEEPRAENGLQLRSRIISQNSFFSLEQHPFSLLTDSCIQFMVGEQSPSLQDYLMSLLGGLQEFITPICQLCIFVISFELSQFAGAEQSSAKPTEQVFDQIVRQHSWLTEAQLMKVQPKISANASLTVEKYFTLQLCLEGKPCFLKDQSYLLKVVQLLLALLEKMIKSETILMLQFLEELCSCLQTLTTVLELLVSLKIKVVLKRLQEIAMTSRIPTILDSFYLQWQRTDNLLKNPAFLQFQQASSLRHSQSLKKEEYFEIQILKTSRYNRPRNKKIQQIISCHKTLQTVCQKPKVFQGGFSLDSLGYRQFVKYIKQLPISADSLIFLLKQVHKEKEKISEKEHSLLRMKNLLFQISQQLQAFSFLEEAILFHLSTSNQIGVDAILEEEAAQMVSKQFLEGVMIPFYFEVKKDLSRLRRCFDLLLCKNLPPREMLRVIKRRDKSLSALMEAHYEKQLASEKRLFIEFCFIQYLLQDFEYLGEEVRRKEKAFRRSPLCNLISFISPE